MKCLRLNGSSWWQFEEGAVLQSNHIKIGCYYSENYQNETFEIYFRLRNIIKNEFLIFILITENGNIKKLKRKWLSTQMNQMNFIDVILHTNFCTNEFRRQ